MKRVFFIALCLLSVYGCGYTTKGFMYDRSTIMIVPVTNKISITSENRNYASYQSSPVLIEKRFTSALVNKFNIEGHLKVVSSETDALKLECAITQYLKEAVRFTDSDDVKEERLRLIVYMKLYNSKGEIIKEHEVSGESNYFLAGSHRKSESVAQAELIDDAARRIVEAVIEEW
ncbi:MAG: LPS assembly lipoprotein LptE [Candidatus Omnitrophica bacterium]|nr:LPS assembly lipoprotein LptE [Candidatus Omnitrophota bacterium]